MAQSPGGGDQMLETARLNEMLLRLDPNTPDRAEVRHRIAKAYLDYSEVMRNDARLNLLPPEMVARESRVLVADRILKQQEQEEERTRKPTATTHRLLGRVEELRVPEEIKDPARLQPALFHFEQALFLDPKDWESAFRLAQIHWKRLDQSDKALVVLDRLIENLPDDPRARLARAQLYTELGRDEQARLDVQKAIELKPDDPQVRLSVAEDALLRRDPAAAQAQLDALPEEWAALPRVQKLRVMVDMLQGQPEEAMALLREGLMASGGSDLNSTVELINLYHQMGRIAEARPLLTRVRQLAPEGRNPVLEILEAEHLALSGRPIEGRKALENLLQQGLTSDERFLPYRSRIYLALARCYADLGEPGRIEQVYRDGLRADPDADVIRVALVRRLMSQDLNRADEVLQEGLRSFPDSVGLKLALVELRLRQQLALPQERRSWNEVDRLLAELDAKLPNHTNLGRLKAERVAQTGDVEATIRELEAITQRSPRSLESWTRLAEFLIRLGRLDQALETYVKAEAPEALGGNAEIRVAHARLLSALNRGRDARELLLKDVDRLSSAQQAVTWKGLGDILLARGERAEARTAYEQWSQLDSRDIRPLLVLMDLALYDNDAAMAEEVARRIDETVAATRVERDSSPQKGAGASQAKTKTKSKTSSSEEEGDDNPFSLLARAAVLLRLQVDPAKSALTEDRRLGEALNLTRRALKISPNLPSALILEAEAMESLRQYDLKAKRSPSISEDDVLAGYRKALDAGSVVALPLLVDRLVGARRFGDVDTLPASMGLFETDRIAAEACLRRGLKDEAPRFITKAVQGRENLPEIQAWRARMFAALGQTELSEQALLALIDQNPDSLAPWLSLIRLHASQKKEIDPTIRRAQERVKSVKPELIEALGRQAAGDFLKADQVFRQALEKFPDDNDVALQAASYFQETGRISVADVCLARILERDPGNRPAARSRAVMLATRVGTPEAWEQALAALGPEVAVGQDAKAVEERLARGVVLARAPDAPRRAEGIRRLEALCEDVSPTLPAALAARSELVQALLREEKFDRACEVAQVSASQEATPQTLGLYAQALLAAGRKTEARGQLDKIAQLIPGDPGEAALRVRLYWDADHPEASAEALEAAFKERVAQAPATAPALGRQIFMTLEAVAPKCDPVAGRIAQALSTSSPGSSWMYGRVLHRQGEPRKALEMARSGLAQSSPSDRVESMRLALLVASETHDKDLLAFADQIIREGFQANPIDRESRGLMAMMHHLAGRYDEEIALYRELLSELSTNVILQNNLAWALCEGRQEFQEALTHANRALESAGDDSALRAMLLDTRGVIFTRLKDYPRAIQDLEAAVQANPSPSRKFHLARAYSLSGEADRARTILKEAIEAGLTAEALEPSERVDFETLNRP
jgi:tetratricopeptide (TPR) repeat protein